MSTEPPLVFTNEWVESQKRRYEKSPPFARPRHYPLWTEARYQYMRDRIEDWVRTIDADKWANVVARLRKPDQFRQMYNELAVADSLRSRGMCLAYEQMLGTQTPDWLISVPETGSRFVLEVVSSNPPLSRENTDDTWARFRQRLEALPGDALLWIQVPDRFDEEMICPAPAIPRQKAIARAVEQFILSDPLPGFGLAVDDMIIRYVGPKNPGTGVSCVDGAIPFWVDGGPLKDAIKEKASKYRNLFQSLKLPLVVSIVADFRTGRGMDQGKRTTKSLVKSGLTLRHTVVNRGSRDANPWEITTSWCVRPGGWMKLSRRHSALRGSYWSAHPEKRSIANAATGRRVGRANAPRSCYFPRICVARTSIDNGVSQRKS